MSDAEQFFGLGDPGGGAAEFAGGDAGEGGQLSPAEDGTRCGKLLGDRPVILFRMQRAVFADGVLQQQIEDRSLRKSELAVLRDDGGGLGLIVQADGLFGLGNESL